MMIDEPGSDFNHTGSMIKFIFVFVLRRMIDEPGSDFNHKEYLNTIIPVIQTKIAAFRIGIQALLSY